MEGNFIGTDPSGISDLGNTFRGVSVTTGNDNVVGGPLPAARNLISGTNGDGIVIFCCGARDNIIQGNYIGTERNGMAALPNDDGVSISGSASANLVGGTEPGAGNVISGNDMSGVHITGDGSDNLVQGNLIGLNATGDAPLRNGDQGILLDGQTGTIIGGTESDARNVISVNPIGVFISGSATSGNLVQGNYIGTDSSGLINIGTDDLQGVLVDDSPANLIGGAVAGAGNLISANLYNIYISGAGATGNLIQGNVIGADATGAAGFDVSGSVGILLIGGSGTIIGGPAGSGNVITFNGGNGGIAITSASTGNNIFGNSIFANDGIGLNLVGGTEDASGVTANDFPDVTSGPTICRIIRSSARSPLPGRTARWKAV